MYDFSIVTAEFDRKNGISGHRQDAGANQHDRSTGVTDTVIRNTMREPRPMPAPASANPSPKSMDHSARAIREVSREDAQFMQFRPTLVKC
jgi:hypothetical protein